MSDHINKIVEWIKHFENILIVIHENPDGDTIASSLALNRVLHLLRKNVKIVGKDLIPGPFLFLPGVEEIQQDYLGGDWDLIIVLDCGDLRRTGFAQRIKKFAKDKKRLINIDHHPKNDLHKIANLNYFDENVAAVGEIIVKIIDKLNVKIDKDIATCILTAVYTDTGGFKHSNTRRETFLLASRMMSLGARLKKITKYISYSKSLESMRLWGMVLSKSYFHSRYKLMVSLISRKDLEESKGSLADLAGVVNVIGSVPKCRASILLVEQEEGLYKASLRTERNDVDVSRIAEIFDGGGHKKAAGFLICAKMLEKQGKRSILIK